MRLELEEHGRKLSNFNGLQPKRKPALGASAAIDSGVSPIRI